MRRTLFLIFFVLIIYQAHAIFLGTTDGYVFNMSNSIVEGANVTVSVSGCSGAGCSESTISDSGGYYVVANLNLNPNGTVIVSASKGNLFGSETGIANQFMAARVNVTLCEPPTKPILTDQQNTHNKTVTLYWTSGTDPHGFITYDQYQLDSNAIENATSPKTETNLSYATHSWRVRTCNTNNITGCCSDWSTDSFTITNAFPSAPNLTDIPHTTQTNISFNWTSGIDPDGDLTYDEFQLSTACGFSSILYNATNINPPLSFNLSTETTYYWRVRTCDGAGCSDWSTDDFFISTPVINISCPPRRGGGGGIIYLPPCIPDWECGNWGSCIGGYMRRKCVDLKHCFEMPETEISCKLPEKIEEKIEEMFFIGNLDKGDIFDRELPIDKTWYFTYKEKNHTIKLTGMTKDSVEIFIRNSITIKKYETRIIDIDEDGLNDIAITLQDLKEKNIIISIVALRPPLFVPVFEKPMVVEFGRLWILNLIIYSLALLELILIIHLYRKKL